MRTQVCSPNLMYKSWAQWNVFIIAHLARQTQVDPWNLLTSSPSLTSEFQDTERPCVQKQDQWFLRNNTGSWPIAPIVYLHTYMCTTAHVPVTFTWTFTPHTPLSQMRWLGSQREGEKQVSSPLFLFSSCLCYDGPMQVALKVFLTFSGSVFLVFELWTSGFISLCKTCL